ncbi:MAG: putative 3-deoxy-D-manno-octulosonate 8-phosphate phosphatase [Pseudomonadota bacterium]|jgi:lipopolysaccharide export system protein LptC
MAALSSSRQLLDRLSIYLPVILMGVLALGSYWLLRATPATVLPAPEQAPRHEPDYFMRNFSVQTFEADGQLKSQLTGKEIRHYPDVDTLEVDQVRMHSYDAEGHPTVITAARALSNGDGSEVQFFGDALVVRAAHTDKAGHPVPKLELRSEFLHAFADTERISTPQPVLLIRGKDQFTANAMDYDNLSRVMDLRGRVVGVLHPTAAR